MRLGWTPHSNPGFAAGFRGQIIGTPAKHNDHAPERRGAGPGEFSPAEAPALRIDLLAPPQLRLASPARTHARNETISRLRGLASADTLPLNLRLKNFEIGPMEREKYIQRSRSPFE